MQETPNKFVPKNEIERQETFCNHVADLLRGQNLFCCIRTFGCQQNEADSERLAGMAEEMGYIITQDPTQADLILFNTCAVREHAELKTLSITGQCKHLKELRPSLRIGICGCMVSQKHREEDIRKSYPYVDFLFGTGQIHRFPEILFRSLTENRRLFLPNDDTEQIAEGLPISRGSAFQAWVSIMYGCNNFCTYCIVPYVRGRERSRKPEDILAEIRMLAEKGYKEITLLGQNVNSYGKDLSTPCDFASLLRRICAIPGDFLIRFMTSHPKDVSPSLIETIAENKKIARQFHLPLQSGSDRILRQMNRKYTLESYLHTVNALRCAIPDIGLSTDLIVGFPTETEEEFSETLQVVSQISYDAAYTFIYSPRRGTAAASMEGQIAEKIKSDRCRRLVELQSAIARKKNEEQVGKTLRALVEGPSKTNSERLTGRTEQNRLVHFSGDRSLIGQWCDLKIEQAEAYALYGSLAENRKENK